MSNKALIADDDPTICLLAAAVLRRAGWAINTVDNGLAALVACANEPYQLALLDIEMPGLDGYQLCAELRRRYGPALGIVLLSGHDDPTTIRSGLALGADDFIPKPIDWATFGERLRPWLTR